MIPENEAPGLNRPGLWDVKTMQAEDKENVGDTLKSIKLSNRLYNPRLKPLAMKKHV